MLNNITLIGRIVRDPELRRTNTGIPVVNFTLAVQRDGKDKETDFIDCQAWRESGENIAKYTKKGDLLAVSGRLQIRTFQGEGGMHKAIQVVLNYWSILASKRKEEQPQYNHNVEQVENYNNNYNNFTTFSGINEDDIQF